MVVVFSPVIITVTAPTVAHDDLRRKHSADSQENTLTPKVIYHPKHTSYFNSQFSGFRVTGSVSLKKSSVTLSLSSKYSIREGDVY